MIGVLQRDHADAPRCVAEDVVLRQRPLELVHLGREAIEELVDGLVETARQILAQSANPDVAREEAEAGDELVDVEQQLALADGVKSIETAPISMAWVPSQIRWLASAAAPR